MRPLSIRARLTLWYGVILAATLLVTGVAVYLMFRHALRETADEAARRYFEHELEELQVVLFTVLPGGLLLATAGGYWLAGRALAPVRRISETARRISAEQLEERIPVARTGDELGQLADTLNTMFARLEQSFTAMRQFTADASHELLTPLTVMRTEAEVTLRAARTADEYRQVLTSLLEEVERLTKLANGLALLSQRDAGNLGASREPVALAELLTDVATGMQVVAQQANLRLDIGALPPVIVEGDPDSLRQVFLNLLDNAVKYNRPQGSVRLGGKLEDGHYVVEVADTGPGISAEHLPHIFDRFYRVDKSRSRKLGGAGLGLSITRALVEAHLGRVEVESTLGQGSTFRVTLPLTSALARVVAAATS